MNTNSHPVNRILLIGLCLSMLMIGTLMISRDSGTTIANAAPPTNPREEHAGGEDHSKKEAALRKVMDGTVDLYFDVEDIKASRAGMTGVTFVGLADITGKELLVFSKGAKEQWLIDPDFVVSFRINKDKGK